MGHERVSVVIAAWNGERYLGEAIDSALGQTRPPHEVVVVDDGSTDATAEVARRHGAHVHRQERRGPGAARNAGVERAEGDHVAFLDADDVWAADKLERQLSALGGPAPPDVVLGHVRQFLTPELSDVRARVPAEAQPAYLPGVAIFPLAVWQRVGPFRSDLRVGEFMDWLLRARELGLRDVMLPEVVLHRRIHLANQTIVERGSLDEYAQILKASLDRRRTRAS